MFKQKSFEQKNYGWKIVDGRLQIERYEKKSFCICSGMPNLNKYIYFHFKDILIAITN